MPATTLTTTITTFTTTTMTTTTASNNNQMTSVSLNIPCHTYPWIQIVELGGAQCNLLVLFLISGLHLQLSELLR